MRFRILPTPMLIAALTTSVHADSTEARCDVYPAGSDHTDKVLRCTISQSQGYVTIGREDGVGHDLSPVGDTPGVFADQHGQGVYRDGNLGDQGLIFRFPDESVYVYWNPAALDSYEGDNPTSRSSIKEYDATTLLRCRAVNAD